MLWHILQAASIFSRACGSWHTSHDSSLIARLRWASCIFICEMLCNSWQLTHSSNIRIFADPLSFISSGLGFSVKNITSSLTTDNESSWHLWQLREPCGDACTPSLKGVIEWQTVHNSFEAGSYITKPYIDVADRPMIIRIRIIIPIFVLKNDKIFERMDFMKLVMVDIILVAKVYHQPSLPNNYFDKLNINI